MPRGLKAKKTKNVIALTGASNYLGKGVMRLLVEDKNIDRLIAIDTHKPDFEHSKLIYYKVDLTSPASQQILGKIFTNEKVTTAVHLIFTYTLSRNRMLAHELEAIGTMHLLDACSEAKVKHVVARSTTAIYGARPGNPNYLTEDQSIKDHEHGSFIHDKLELERQMQQYASHHSECRVAILRDCTSMGPTSINYLSSLLLQKRTARVLGFDPLVQFIHEDDLFRAYYMAITGNISGVFNIVGKGVVRYSEAIKRLGGSEVVLPETVLRASTAVLWGLKLYDIPATFINHTKYSWVADGKKAASELGFIPKYDCFAALDYARTTRSNKTA